MVLTHLGRAAWLGTALLLGALALPGAAAGPASPSPASPSPASQRYDDWFTGEAMRVDLFHTGTAREAAYSLDEVVWEPLWPGTRAQLIDPFGYGSHRLRVHDAATGRELFRQGYSTLFEEWAGTPEAVAGLPRTMSESVRFPWPKKPVVLRIDGRRKGVFEEELALTIDPGSHLISRVQPFAGAEVLELSDGPPPEQAADLLIVPEGYGPADGDKLRADAARFASALLESEPWRSMRRSVHVRAVVALSPESGVSEPRKGIFRDTLLGSAFNSFDSERYLTVSHTKRLRQVASVAPYDALLVMVNSSRYGGGGVFGQWAVFVSDNEYDDYVMLHELGHSFGGLGDEYYDSAISTDEDALYPPGLEPWEPNLSAFLGGQRDAVKWRDLISASTPLPTPEAGADPAVVGLFEGAGYKAKGLYRPQKDCKMFHKGLIGFCAVCRRSLERVVRYHAGEEPR